MATVGTRLFLALFVAGGAVFAGCGAEGTNDNGPPASVPETATPPGAADATPTPVPGEIPAHAPDELVNRLLGGESQFPGLPPGYSVEGAETSREDSSAAGAERVLAYSLLGPDSQNSVTFRVFADDASAGDGYSRLTAGSPVPPERISGLGYPAKTLSYGAQDRSAGYTIIYVLAGQTVVEALSGVAGEAPSGDFGHALELARAGIDHILTSAAR